MKTITIKRPKAFDIKETDSIEKIEEMQQQLKEYITKLQSLYDAIEEFKKEKKSRYPSAIRGLGLKVVS